MADREFGAAGLEVAGASPGASLGTLRRGTGRSPKRHPGSRRAARPGWRRRRGRAASRSAPARPCPRRARRRRRRRVSAASGPRAGPKPLSVRWCRLTASRISSSPGSAAPLDPTVVGEAGVERACQAPPQRDQPLDPIGRDEVEQRGSGEDVGRLVAEDLEVGPQVEAAVARGRARDRLAGRDQRGIDLDQGPALPGRQARRQAAQGRAGAGTEVDDVRPTPRPRPRRRVRPRGGRRRRGRRRAHATRARRRKAPAHRTASPPRVASAAPIAAAVPSQRGQALARRHGAGPETGTQAGVRQRAAQGLPEGGRVTGGTRSPASGGTVSATAPPEVATTGKPRARPSASAMP